MNATPELPRAAWFTALLSLGGLGPSRLSALLAQADAEECWGMLCDGSAISPASVSVSATKLQSWRNEARRFDVAAAWRLAGELGVTSALRGERAYPARLLDDIESPAVLFRLGRPVPDLPTVAIVGTRKCTSYGRRVAHGLAAALSTAGVSIVSGLALGIDAAAHAGALSVVGAPPIGVVGSGLDVVYPRNNRTLWTTVADRGTLLSEAPARMKPEPWRFPARNRIIAGLADAVVVVESHSKGGSLLTVDEAQLRDIAVGAVPGPVTSAAARGSNQLLVEGAVPILDADDVLSMIGHVANRNGSSAGGPESALFSDSSDSSESAVLVAVGSEPQLFEDLCRLTSLDSMVVAAEVERLVAAGHCAWSGPWIERIG